MLVGGRKAIHHLDGGAQSSGEGHGLLHAADDAILGKLASLVGLDALDGAGVDEGFLGATVDADEPARAWFGAAALALHGDDCVSRGLRKISQQRCGAKIRNF